MNPFGSDLPVQRSITALWAACLILGASCTRQADRESSPVLPQSIVESAAAPQSPRDFILLPVLAHATPEVKPVRETRAQLSISADGRIYSRGEQLWNPEVAEDAFALRAWLQSAADAMPKAQRPGSPIDSPPVPSAPLRIHADRNAPFVLVARLTDECLQTSGLWKFEVAALIARDVGTPEERFSEGFVDLSRPVAPEITNELLFCEPPESRVRVVTPGSRRRRLVGEGSDAANSPGFEYSDERVLEYSQGPLRTDDLSALAQKVSELDSLALSHQARISAGWGTTCGEVLEVVDMYLAAGLESFHVSAP